MTTEDTLHTSHKTLGQQSVPHNYVPTTAFSWAHQEPYNHLSLQQNARQMTITRLKVLGRMAAVVVLPSVPVLVWWKYARDDRLAHTKEVETKVRVPNVQTIDDMLVEKCQPGDVILFDRRCQKCASGPVAALSCFMGRSLLCKHDGKTMRAVQAGAYDHCGKFYTMIYRFRDFCFLNCYLFTQALLYRVRSTLATPPIYCSWKPQLEKELWLDPSLRDWKCHGHDLLFSCLS
jgi:hypothetical protein